MMVTQYGQDDVEQKHATLDVLLLMVEHCGFNFADPTPDARDHAVRINHTSPDLARRFMKLYGSGARILLHRASC